MEWLAKMFEKYPEMGVYIAVGIGYLVGRLKFRGFGLGVVTSSLLAGIAIGNAFHIAVSDQAKALLFLMFLFGIGYSVGPGFFRNLKGEGWRWAVLGIIVPVIGLATAYGVAKFLRLDPGFAAGLLSGALTESPAIGTAIEAIRSLPIGDDQKQLLASHVAAADAICYIFGTVGVIWVCSVLGPWMLRIDLREEAEKVEKDLGITTTKIGIQSAWRPISCRAYRLPVGAPIVGKTVAVAEKSLPEGRLFIERIRRDGEMLSPQPTTVLEAEDTVAILGRTDILVKVLGPKSAETADSELLQIPIASYDVYVTNKEIAGKTLKQVGDTVDEAHGVLLRGLVRQGKQMPVGFHVVVERGDTLQVSGTEAAVDQFASIAGKVMKPSNESDLSLIGLGISLGIFLGAAIVFPVAGLRITLGTSVGTLLVALVIGWFRSVKPVFAVIPEQVILFMRSLGLAAFVAMVGLKAGPMFIATVKQAGLVLFLGGIVVTLVPLILGILIGRHVLHLNPILLLGGIAGAQTMIAGTGGIQEKSDSAIATLGYSYTAALGHILLTTWGTVIVSLIWRA